MKFFEFLKPPVLKPKGAHFESFLIEVEQLFCADPEYWIAERDAKGQAKITVLIFRDFPEKGWMSGLTYGLSNVEPPLGAVLRPELCLTMQSKCENWALLLGHIAVQLQGKCPFTPGICIPFGQQMVEDSKMDALVVALPDYLKDLEPLTIQGSWPIQLVGLVPIYAGEIPAFQNSKWALGLEEFPVPIFDPQRASCTDR